MNKRIYAASLLLLGATVFSCTNEQKDESVSIDDKANAIVQQLKEDTQLNKAVLRQLSVDDLSGKVTKPVTVQQCSEWITDHVVSPEGEVIPAKSFLIKMDTLDNHLNNLVDGSGNKIDRKEIKYLHVFLARKGGTKDSTTIVISAVRVVNNIGQHVYQQIGTTYNVLEHSIPCPDCIDGSIKVHKKVDNSDPL